MEIIIKKITPATIESNIEELDKYIEEIKNKYSDVVVTENFVAEGKEERAKLNKLKKNLGDVRKKVEKDGLADVQKFIAKLKEAEKTVGDLSENINNQVREFEEEEKKAKLNEIQELKKTLSNVSQVELKIDDLILDNPKWLNKTYKKSDIEKEIKEQVEKIVEKYKFIIAQIQAANEEIENKISFADIITKFTCSLDEIIKYILQKKNEIKSTEENMKRKAEEDKQRAIEEANAKAEKEKAEAIEKAKEDERKRIELEQKNNSNPPMQSNNASEQPKIDENPYRIDTPEKEALKQQAIKNLKLISTTLTFDNVKEEYRKLYEEKYGEIEKTIINENAEDKTTSNVSTSPMLTFININVSGLTEEATNDLLKVIEDHKIHYEKNILHKYSNERAFIGKGEERENFNWNDYELIEEKITDKRRWESTEESIYKRKSDNKYFTTWRTIPNTEKQEGGEFVEFEYLTELETKFGIIYQFKKEKK